LREIEKSPLQKEVAITLDHVWEECQGVRPYTLDRCHPFKRKMGRTGDKVMGRHGDREIGQSWKRDCSNGNIR